MNKKTLVITGGSSGIGFAIIEIFVGLGYSVINIDKQQFPYKNESILTHLIDICNYKALQECIEVIPSIDCLINNAGIYKEGTLQEQSIEIIKTIIDTNILGAINTTKLCIEKMHKGSVIINISSGLSLRPEYNSIIYCITKSAINTLTQCLAQEYIGIRVNAILPGPIDTPLLHNAIKDDSVLQSYIEKNPAKRMGTTKEVALMAKYLVSDDALYINGGLFTIDGGESIASIYN